MLMGKDGCVRQLCGPGIAPILPGCAKKIHVKKEAPTSVGKKHKVVALQSIRVWRRKEVPSTMSSLACQEGGRGVEGRQDLKMKVKMKSGDMLI